MSKRQVEPAPARRRVAPKGAAALVAALALVAVLGGARAWAYLPALHAGDREIRDTYGRQVLLRGVNVTALSDPYQVNPRLRPVVPLREGDYRRMAAMGFDVIRLAVNWSKLEPERGQINQEFIDRMAAVIHEAAANGMYTVIDMHNGGWGKGVATPPDEVCPRGLEPSHGWEGAPLWATFLDDQTTCHDGGTHKRTPAVKAAWNNFWANFKQPLWLDGKGIQDHLVDVWAALAHRFARDPAVAGYDLLNEPDPGTTRNQQSAYVTRFTADSIAAIRRAEAAAHGFPHLVFFEPNITWTGTALATHSPEPGFTSDPNIVFAPHLYGRDAHTTHRGIGPVRHVLKKQARQVIHRARAYGSPLWIGEWGFSAFDEDSLKKVRTHSEIQDSKRLGSAWWQWKVACGAPQNFDGLDKKPQYHILGNLNPTRCPSGRPLKRPEGWEAVISRAYPRFSPGTLTRLRSHGSRMSLKGESPCNAALRRSEPRACKLVVWIPKHEIKHTVVRPRFEARNLLHLRARKARGGWIATAEVRGSYSLKTK